MSVRGAAQRSSFYARNDREAARQEAEDANADAPAPIDRKRRREHAALDAELDAMTGGEPADEDELPESNPKRGRMHADDLDDRPSRRRRVTGERAALPDEVADRWVKREESVEREPSEPAMSDRAPSEDDLDGRPLDEAKPVIRSLLSRLGPEPSGGMRGWADE